jgi:hypothetical protein
MIAANKMRVTIYLCRATKERIPFVDFLTFLGALDVLRFILLIDYYFGIAKLRFYLGVGK